MKSDFSLIKNFRIIFSNSGMQFKDNTIVLPTKTSNIIEIFGSQPRILNADKETGNMFYFWDNFGIYAIKDVKSKTIVEISIAMNKDENQEEFYPFSMFNGDIQIEEFVFNCHRRSPRDPPMAVTNIPPSRKYLESIRSFSQICLHFLGSMKISLIRQPIEGIQ